MRIRKPRSEVSMERSETFEKNSAKIGQVGTRPTRQKISLPKIHFTRRAKIHRQPFDFETSALSRSS